jgi:spore coat protein U-like protein
MLLHAVALAAATWAAGQLPVGFCTIQSPNALAFGTYDPLGANATVARDATATIQYNCRGGARPAISLSAGSAASYAPRTLRFGGDSLGYNLYSDAARTVVWGDGTAGTQVVNGAPGRRTYTIYGRIFPGQVVASGGYVDTIVITYNY